MDKTIIFIAVCVIFALPGCGQKPGSDTVIVSVGGKDITIRDFNERLTNLPERYREVVNKRKDEYLQELINDTLLYQEALRKGLHEDKDAKKVIEEAKKKILIARLLRDEVDAEIDITEEDIVEFYEENQDRYMTPEVMRVSHILVPTMEDAKKIQEELAKGASFEDVARAKSVDPTAQRGGDIGYFPKGQLMPEFEAGCADLEIDEVSGIVKTKLGYHIIKLTDKRDPQLRPIDQVKDKIKIQLRAIKRQNLFNDLLTKLRGNTEIKINEKALDAAGSKENQEKNSNKEE